MMQVPLRKGLVAAAVANTQFEAKLKKGATIHYPYLSHVEATAYRPGEEYTPSSIVATDQKLEVDTMYVVPNYVEDIEELQSNYAYQMDIADDAAYKLRDKIDQAVLESITAAEYGFENNSGIGTVTAISAVIASGASAITATSANIHDIFTGARKGLRELNVEDVGDLCAVVTPGIAEKIELVALDKGFNVADSTLKNGYAGNFLGFQVFVTNNLPTSYTYFGRKGMIHLVAQVPPKMTIKDVPKQLGKYLVASTVFGKKVFKRNASRFLCVKAV